MFRADPLKSGKVATKVSVSHINFYYECFLSRLVLWLLKGTVKVTDASGATV